MWTTAILHEKLFKSDILVWTEFHFENLKAFQAFPEFKF